jgi:hypothetical protein
MNNRHCIVMVAGPLGLCLALSAVGQTPAPEAPAPQFNVIYQCVPPLSAKVFSCAGTAPTATCDVQNYRDGTPVRRFVLMRQQITAGLQQCHLQTAAEAHAHPPGPDLPLSAANTVNRPAGANPAQTANQVGAGGFKVGDTVRVPLGEGKILQVRGAEYFVRNSNGVEIWMSYPAQIKRMGKLTAQDHALGQYDAHDPVQVLVQGKWLDGEVIRQSDTVFTVKLANGNEVDGPAQFLRPSTAPQAAAVAKAEKPAPPSGPPKGMISCAGKLEGRYASAAGSAGLVTIVFRSGKATVREPDVVATGDKVTAMSSEKEAECWTGGGKIFLRWLDGSKYDFPIDINDDGTLDTTYGELKKKSN